jgi:hypothetical protein
MPNVYAMPVGTREERAVFLEERGRHTVVRERRVVEIAEHGSGAGGLHGTIVVRAREALGRALMTRGTHRLADVYGLLRGGNARRSR